MIVSLARLVGAFVGFWILVYAVAVFRKYKKSYHKTIKNCAIDIALSPLRWFKLGPYNKGEKMVREINYSLEYAKKKTGLSDFGELGFKECYSKLMNSEVQRSEKFTNLGYIAAKIELGMGWVRRLKLIDYLKKNPDVLKVPVRSPVFLMGLPRTGTTYLHRLLSLDPAVRAPALWELLAPVPAPDGAATQEAHDNDRAKRGRYVKKLIATRKSMGDYALERIHEVGWDLPEECLLGLSDELPILIQYLHADYLNIDEFLSLDSTAAYRYYKTMLQLLSFQVNDRVTPKRWTLKCPIHLFYPKQIAKVFPDAKFIWTHRHPLSAVPSLCSLVQAAHSVYYEPDNMNVNRLGLAIDKLTDHLISTTPNQIKETKCDSIDANYEELIKNPKELVKSIYRQFNWEFSSEYEKILDEFIQNDINKRNQLKQAKTVTAKTKNPKDLHEYSPESYGLTRERLCTGNYATYIKQYNLSPPKDK